MTALALKLDPAADLFQEDFAANSGDLPGAGLAWLDERREKAMDAYSMTGVPHRRVEAWKFTDLASVLENGLKPVEASVAAFTDDAVFGASEGGRVVLVNGVVRQTMPADGLEIVDLGKIDARTPDWVRAHLGLLAAGADQPMGAVSLALMRGGVALRVTDAATLNLDFVNPPLVNAVSHIRVLIVVEANASLRLLQSHRGDGTSQYFANLGIELVLKEGARVEHVLLQAEAATALHVASIGAALERDSSYTALYAATGAKLSRADVYIRLDGPGAHAAINNIAVPGSAIADTTTVMDHAKPHTTSRQLFKSVVGDGGRSVSQGRVLVREGAMKSDSHQLFKALLLSPRAEADAKPELEIFADDVVCGHGTAIGALDDDALFYLRARGIPEDEARGMLVRAFLEDAMTDIGGDAVRDALWRRLDAALAAFESAKP